MADTPKKKGYGRVFVILLVVGLLVLLPLTWLALRMSRDAQRRRVVNANEAAAIYTLEQIAAAEMVQIVELCERGVEALGLEGVL